MLSLLCIKSTTIDLAMEVVVNDSGLRASPPPWLVTLVTNVALPTTVVTSPCKGNRRVECFSWSVFNWKYIGDCVYLRWSTGLRLLDLLLGLSGRSLSLLAFSLLLWAVYGVKGSLACGRVFSCVQCWWWRWWWWCCIR